MHYAPLHTQMSTEKWWLYGEVCSRPIIKAITHSKVPFQLTRGAQGHKTRWEMQIKDGKEGASYQTCSRTDWASFSRCDTIKKSQCWSTSCLLPKGRGAIMRWKRKTFQDCTGFSMGCLGEELSAGKGNLGDLRRCGKKKDE